MRPPITEVFLVPEKRPNVSWSPAHRLASYGCVRLRQIAESGVTIWFSKSNSMRFQVFRVI